MSSHSNTQRMQIILTEPLLPPPDFAPHLDLRLHPLLGLLPIFLFRRTRERRERARQHEGKATKQQAAAGEHEVATLSKSDKHFRDMNNVRASQFIRDTRQVSREKRGWSMYRCAADVAGVRRLSRDS